MDFKFMNENQQQISTARTSFDLARFAVIRGPMLECLVNRQIHWI